MTRPRLRLDEVGKYADAFQMKGLLGGGNISMIDQAFFILQANKTKRLASIFRRRDWAKILVIFTTLLIFLLLSLGVFLFSLSSFQFLSQYPIASRPIIIYVLAITFILTSLLSFTSAITTGLGILFQRKDNSLLFSLPIKTATIFESRLIEVILLSSWPIAVFALPQILGYGIALELRPFSTFLFLIGTLFLTLFTTQLGVIIVLIISRFWGNLKNKFLWMFWSVAIPLLAIGLIKILLPSELMANLETFSVEEIARLVNRQTLMAEFLPTTWLVKLIYFWEKESSLAIQNLIFLAVSYLAVLILLILLRGKFYLKAVNKTAEGRFIAAPWDVVKKTAHSFPYFLKGKMGSLTEKDWLVVFRSPGQIFQAFFIIFLEIIYFLIMTRVPLERVQKIFPEWHQLRLLQLNFLFVNYFVSIFAMRFLFPMMSLEGHSSWVIWSAPLKRMKIFWQKLISSFLIILFWIEISTLLSLKVINLSFSQQWPLFLTNLPLTLTITIITLGIGAIKPNFWEKNPEKLSTSPGGILATALCLGYIGLATLFLSLPLVICFLSGLVIIPIIFQVSRSINKYEI